jgi:hypothetical protein
MLKLQVHAFKPAAVRKMQMDDSTINSHVGYARLNHAGHAIAL